MVYYFVKIDNPEIIERIPIIFDLQSTILIT